MGARGADSWRRFPPERLASSVVLFVWQPVAPLLFAMSLCLSYEVAANDLPALAFCWSCNWERPVVEFNPRTRRGLCGPCRGMIFRGGPCRGLSDAERGNRKQSRLERVHASWLSGKEIKQRGE